MKKRKHFPRASARLVALGLLTCWALNACNSTPEETHAQRRVRPTRAASEPPPTDGKGVVLFFGNSLTAGYGVEPGQAFPALVGHRIDSLNLPYKVVNAGLSGETTAGGRSRIGWVLRQPVAVFVLELGGNDGLRGISVKSTRQNLQAIIDTVRRKSPEAKIVLAGMQIPPNLGTEYSAQFRGIYPELARENNATLIPFLLEGVGGIPRLNQPDGIHPTPVGHQLVAKTVWRVLEPLLREETASR
jgi:acyl-CoA thioesterase-1